MVTYYDSCILIYFLDDAGTWHRRAADRLARIAREGDLPATSDLVRLECRVQPLRLGDRDRLPIFDAFFRRSDIRRVPITSSVFELATSLRARHNFKLRDSIHLAAAIEAGCDSFLTNDARLTTCTAIPIEMLA